jgi:SAM-dependent methyltransferase
LLLLSTRADTVFTVMTSPRVTIDAGRRHTAARPTGLGQWEGYLDPSFSFADYPEGARVLDLGFGEGRQLADLTARGCVAFGLEADRELARRAAARGQRVVCARAERLPFASASFDGLICEVVLPYTDEARAIQEIGRVLRPGGVARLSYHGLGYPLRDVVSGSSWRTRVYGTRVLINTWWYALTGFRLPGFLGDTVYQSRRRLRRHYLQAGLELEEQRLPRGFAGAPVFLYHRVRRRLVA